MFMIKCVNNVEIEKIEFKKVLDKFVKIKWFRGDCVFDKNDKIRFLLIYWVCMFGKYKVLEYFVSEKGFEFIVKVGKN